LSLPSFLEATGLASLGFTPRELIAWGVVLLVALAVVVGRRLGSWRRSLRARRRGRRAVAGEGAAEALLERAGFRIVDRQARLAWQVDIDGTPTDIELRADLLAERDGRTFVAEVKTGAEAPSVSTAATRRQLLEYLVAYETDAVLLVDVENARIREVTFPL